ncbi:Transmembrane protein 63C [Xylographa trunciseda]|nr:Transmembrane protein 63C [Xylographa trunciseda]
MLVITLFFSLLRPHNTTVYAPKLKHADKQHAPPPIGKGLFAWFSPLVTTHEDQLVDKVGMDAVIFLRFTKMCRNMFLVLSIVGCGILIPVHILESSDYPTGSPTERAFATMTPQYVLEGTPMWSHVVCTWVFDITIVFFLWRNYRAVARLKRLYFESSEYRTSLHSRTLWLADIPHDERSGPGLLKILGSIDKTAGTPQAYVAWDVKDLPELIEQHDQAVRKLESILAKYLKNPDKLPTSRPMLRPSKNDRKASQVRQIDAIDYLTNRIIGLRARIYGVREEVGKRERDSDGPKNSNRKVMPYGFATYESVEEAHSIAYAARKYRMGGVSIQLAPKPNDLIWDNLALAKGSRKAKRFMNNIWVALLTVVWIIPNSMIAVFLTRLSNLSAVWPAFAATFDANPTTWAAVQAVAAPGLTSLVYLLLPILFRRLQIRAGDMTKTSREHHVMNRLYAFFVFNNLIVFSTVSGIWLFVTLVIGSHNDNESVWDAINTGDLPSKIMVALCTFSPFWVTWLLQRNLGAAVDLAQIINLTWIWFARTFMNPTPRQTIEWTAPPPFDYASYYNYFLFYSTVSLCYATIQPIVLPVTFLYFVIDCWLKKYLLLYVFITKTESGGQFWNVLFNRVLFATFLANCIAALVIKAAFGSWTMLGCMLPLPIILLVFKIYCTRTFEDQCKYYIGASVKKDPEAFSNVNEKSHQNSILAVKFGNPALFKLLMSPMVHEKARHLLSEIDGGRLGSDSASTAAYSDIAMGHMSSTVPGKPAASTKAGGIIKYVPDANLDFAFYKNDPAFSSEHGGGGELYDRVQTPAPSAAGGSRTGSRANSPARGFAIGSKHAPYRDGGYDSDVTMNTRGRGFYTHSNDSESDRRLLTGAQSVGVADEPGREDYFQDGASEYGQLGLDRWRPGGSGYVGVPGVEDEDQPLAYDTYRPAKGAL